MSDDDQHIPNSVRNSSLWFKLIAYSVYGAFWVANRILNLKSPPK